MQEEPQPNDARVKTDAIAARVRVVHTADASRVWLNGQEVSNQLAIGGVQVAMPDGSDEFDVYARVTLTFHAELDLGGAS